MYKDALKQLGDFEGPTLYLHFQSQVYFGKQ